MARRRQLMLLPLNLQAESWKKNLQDARFLRCSSMIKLSVQCQSERIRVKELIRERKRERERENKSVQKRTVTPFTIWF